MGKVGTVLKIQHTQAFKGGNASLKKVKPRYVTIALEYADGDVQAERSSDTWKVAKSNDPRAQYETVDY
jgi:hypothetical protein